ncbi:MAG: CdaR family protein [Clostridiales bacterium]|nr:CdaR family protein [Clostridiales bacterium]
MKKFVRTLFFRNWELKLLSLILAFLLWISLIPEEKIFSEKTLTIPLESRNIPPNMELVEKPEASVDVTIRAPNRLINEISSANVYAKLNLEKATVFQQEYPLNETMISIPPGAEVVRITPNKVKLKLERTEEAWLDIAPNIIGKVKEGYGVAKIEVLPGRVLVKGPESKVREKDKVTTSPVNVSELEQSTEVEADLILPKPDLRLATPVSKVRVRILVQEEKLPASPEVKKKK